MTDIISHKYNFNLEDIRIYFIAVSVGRYLDRSNSTQSGCRQLMKARKYYNEVTLQDLFIPPWSFVSGKYVCNIKSSFYALVLLL